MKKILITILILTLLSCAGSYIPKANLKFIKINKKKSLKYKNIYSYYLYFSSDINLEENFNKKKTITALDCFFKKNKVEDKDFYSYGLYPMKINSSSLKLSSRYKKDSLYYTEIYFYERNSSNNSYSTVSKNEYLKKINALSKDMSSFKCAIRIVPLYRFGKKYISNTMLLPKSEIL